MITLLNHFLNYVCGADRALEKVLYKLKVIEILSDNLKIQYKNVYTKGCFRVAGYYKIHNLD